MAGAKRREVRVAGAGPRVAESVASGPLQLDPSITSLSDEDRQSVLSSLDVPFRELLQAYDVDEGVQVGIGLSTCTGMEAFAELFTDFDDAVRQAPTAFGFSGLAASEADVLASTLGSVWAGAKKKVVSQRRAAQRAAEKAIKEAERRARREADQRAKQEQKETERRQLEGLKEAERKAREEQAQCEAAYRSLQKELAQQAKEKAKELKEAERAAKKEVEKKAKQEEAELRAAARKAKEEEERRLKEEAAELKVAARRAREEEAAERRAAAQRTREAEMKARADAAAATPRGSGLAPKGEAEAAPDGQERLEAADADVDRAPAEPAADVGRGPADSGAAAQRQCKRKFQRLVLSRGSVICVRSMPSQPQINGRTGICLGRSSCGDRWTINIDGDGEVLRTLPRENLEVLAKSSCCLCGPSMKRLKKLQHDHEQLKKRARRGDVEPAEAVRAFAALECGLLEGRSPSEHRELKRKLMLKWHPDKAPSEAHAALATQVVQEMQLLPQWQS